MRSATINFLALLAIFAFAFSACTADEAPQEEKLEETVDDKTIQSRKRAWEAALDSYHTLMSDAFHSAEEDNLEPLKQKYGQMGAVAKAWVKIPVPKEYQKDNIAEALKELEKESLAMAKVVEEGTEAEMKEAIYALHDVFHKVQELCQDH